ncbi:hypothetical protein ACOME3_005961 [Neoechinorhynchus agilis]
MIHIDDDEFEDIFRNPLEDLKAEVGQLIEKVRLAHAKNAVSARQSIENRYKTLMDMLSNQKSLADSRIEGNLCDYSNQLDEVRTRLCGTLEQLEQLKLCTTEYLVEYKYVKAEIAALFPTLKLALQRNSPECEMNYEAIEKAFRLNGDNEKDRRDAVKQVVDRFSKTCYKIFNKTDDELDNVERLADLRLTEETESVASCGVRARTRIERRRRQRSKRVARNVQTKNERTNEASDQLKNAWESDNDSINANKMPKTATKYSKLGSKPDENFILPFTIEDADPFCSLIMCPTFEPTEIPATCDFTDQIMEVNMIDFIDRNKCIRRLYETHGTSLKRDDEIKVLSIASNCAMLIQHRNYEQRISELFKRADSNGYLKFPMLLLQNHEVHNKTGYYYNDILVLRCCQKHMGRVWLMSQVGANGGLVDVYDVDKGIAFTVYMDDLYYYSDSFMATDPINTAYCCLYESFVTFLPHFENSDRATAITREFLMSVDAKIRIKGIQRCILNEEYHLIDLYNLSTRRTIKKTLESVCHYCVDVSQLEAQHQEVNSLAILKKLQVAEPEVDGRYYLAPYTDKSGTEDLYRVKVIARIEDRMIVYYIDYGNFGTINRSSIYHCPVEISKRPCTLKCLSLFVSDTCGLIGHRVDLRENLDNAECQVCVRENGECRLFDVEKGGYIDLTDVDCIELAMHRVIRNRKVGDLVLTDVKEYNKARINRRLPLVLMVTKVLCDEVEVLVADALSETDTHVSMKQHNVYDRMMFRIPTQTEYFIKTGKYRVKVVHVDPREPNDLYFIVHSEMDLLLLKIIHN